MCTPERRCPEISLVQAMLLTTILTRRPEWTGGQVRVMELPRRDRGHAEGACQGRTVYYRDGCTLCTVPHELAHVLAKNPSHNDAWRTAFVELAHRLERELTS